MVVRAEVRAIDRTGPEMEAMAAARPVVTTHIAGIPELVTHGASGLLVPPGDDTAAAVLMESLLLVVESMMSYRRRYRSGVSVASLLEMVVTDALNPRSLAYQLSRLEEHVNELPDERQPGYLSDLKRLALESATMVRLADVRQLAEVNPQTQRRDTLAAFLGGMSQRLPALSRSLAATYFQVAETPQKLVPLAASTQPCT